MSNIARVAGQAANTTSKPLDITDMFSTYLYEGTGSAQTITNGIDLDGEGGLVWGKVRDIVDGHYLVDSERGKGTNNNFKYIRSDTAGAELDLASRSLSSFNSNGFTFQAGDSQFNASGNDYVSWTFRKAPKFFDVVTWTGNSAVRTISHDLGSAPGMILIKSSSTSGDWTVYHRGLSNPLTKALQLNTTSAEVSGRWNSTSPTSTEFTLTGSIDVNGNGRTFVAYLFAHNDSGDGEFGPDGDQDIIKCGSYTGTATLGSPTINLGFEPQWVLIKRTDSTGFWLLQDNMRSLSLTNTDMLYPNFSSAATTGPYPSVVPTATGFYIGDNGTNYNANGGTYIYMAIRRGPLAVPEDATKVFDLSVSNYSANQTIAANIDVTDTFMVGRSPTGNNSNGLFLFNRLTGNKRLRTDLHFTENPEVGLSGFDTQSGVVAGSSDNSESVWKTSTPLPRYIKYFMKRAPGFFDVVPYDGDATAYPNSRNINHNLGVAPEMIWIKCRSAGENWAVYHSGVGATKYMNLNNTNAAATNANWWRNTAPTDTVFTIGHQDDVNLNGGTHIAYLFATLDGVSKVGTYTGNGSSQTINCGFTSGARFILIKRTDATGDWYFWDTARGIVAGNDPYLALNWTNQAEVTSNDSIDPASSGFIVNQVSATNVNVSSADYIFYAIA